MKKAFILSVALFSVVVAFAQDNITEQITPLIKGQYYDSATRVVNSYLRIHPESVDGIIMKADIIFYRYESSIPGIMLKGNEDESIYEHDMGSIEQTPVIISKDTADKITSILMQALVIDKTRADVYGGICYIYSMALQTDKLIDFLPKFKENIQMDSTAPYTLADYARNMEERNDFDDAMKVYQKIADMFPQQPGILSDMAAEYSMHGDWEKARALADQVMMKQGTDKTSYHNVFFIYGVLEDYTDADKANVKCAELSKDYSCLAYKGLVAFCEGKDYKTIFNKITPSDTMGYEIIKCIGENTPPASMDSYNKIASLNLSDAYMILIDKYYKQHTPYFLPAFNYANLLAYNSRYKEAAKAFEEIKTDTITKLEKETLLFCSAWAYYKTGDLTKANERWLQLLNSDDFYKKSAAAYFLGKYYTDKKDTQKAQEYFSLVSGDADKSKYAAYCKNMLEKNQN